MSSFCLSAIGANFSEEKRHTRVLTLDLFYHISTKYATLNVMNTYDTLDTQSAESRYK
jgi:hypothetical protein